MKQFTIIEEKWARGQRNGNCNLLNDNGNMCCLGFLCISEGAVVNVGEGLPRHVGNLPGHLLPLLEKSENDPTVSLEWAIAKINDDSEISDNARKEKLAPLFSEIGFEARYV